MLLLFLPVLLLFVSFAWAQPTLVLNGKLPGTQLDITPYTFFYEDLSGDTLPFSVVQTKPFRPLVQKYGTASTSNRPVFITKGQKGVFKVDTREGEYAEFCFNYQLRRTALKA